MTEPEPAGESEVIELTSQEFERAVNVTVSSTGYTFEQLREQADSHAFVSERARIVWSVVSDLSPS